MKLIGGYRYYSRREHEDYCAKNGIPPVSAIDEPYRNKRTLCGRPLLDKYYDKTF